MAWQQTPYTLPLLLSAAASVVLAGYVSIFQSRRSSTTTIPFVAGTLIGAIWSAGYALQLASVDLADKAFWSQYVWLGAITLPTIWLLFVLGHTGHDEWFTRERLALLAVEPTVMLVAVWTSGFHGYFVESVSLSSGGAFTGTVASFGPLFWFHVGYAYLLALAGVVLLATMVVQSRGVYRRQSAMLLLAGLLPLLGSTLSMTGVLRFSNVDPTPLSFAFTNLVIAWALLHDRLFNIVPVARDRVIEELSDGIVVLDSSHRILDSNPAAGRILGDETSMVGTRIDDIAPELGELVGAGETNEIHEVRIDREETRRVLDAHVSPISDPLDSHSDYTLVLRDVTERHDMERQFRTLIDGSSDLITVVDRDGTRRYVSPSMKRLLGHDPDELSDEGAFSLVHPDDMDVVRQSFSDLLDGKREMRVECRVRHADGSWRTFESIATNFLDDPVIDGVLITSRDVTERRGYEQRLRVLNRVLRHDLRNDVNVILGNVDLLKSELTPEGRRRARTIEEKSMELVDLSEKARQIDYTVHHMGNTMRSVDVGETLVRHIDLVRSEHPDVLVTYDVPDDEYVYADDLLGSAIDNVLENAIEHNDQSRPELHVSVESTSVGGIEYVDVNVADNGPGIHEEERRILTERTETPLHHASGLGLWLVNWIVDNSDGTLLFAENEPRGSVVTLRLRRSEATETVDAVDV